MASIVFSVYDWLVFSAILGVSVGIGIFYAFIGGKQKTSKEYLLADKSMGYFPVAMSLLASLFTGIYVQVTYTKTLNQKCEANPELAWLMGTHDCEASSHQVKSEFTFQNITKLFQFQSFIFSTVFNGCCWPGVKYQYSLRNARRTGLETSSRSHPHEVRVYSNDLYRVMWFVLTRHS